MLTISEVQADRHALQAAAGTSTPIPKNVAKALAVFEGRYRELNILPGDVRAINLSPDIGGLSTREIERRYLWSQFHKVYEVDLSYSEALRQ